MLTLGAGGLASAQTTCALNAPAAGLTVVGVAGDWIAPPVALAAVQRAEAVLHGQITQKYLLLPRIQVVARLGANALSVFAAVPPGQLEAALASGLRYAQAMRLVILPQAIRLTIPPLGNTVLNMIKNSSLVSAISIADPGRTSTRKSSCSGGCGARGRILKTAPRISLRVASGTLTKTSAPKSYA